MVLRTTDGAVSIGAAGLSIADVVKQCRDNIASHFMVHHTKNLGSAKPGQQVNGNGLAVAFQVAREAPGIESSGGRTPATFHEIRSLAEHLYREQYGA